MEASLNSIHGKEDVYKSNLLVDIFQKILFNSWPVF